MPDRRQSITSHVAEKVALIGAKSSHDLSARDYSIEYQEKVCNRFLAVKNMKQTARDFSLPVRIVNEILHLAALRKPVGRAVNVGGECYSVRDLRRSA